MFRRASALALLRYTTACVSVPGVVLPFLLASSAPAAETAGHAGTMASPDPCSARLVQCTVTWSADSEYCKNRNDKESSGKCTTLFQCQAETLAAAKEFCEDSHGAGKSGVESCGPCNWMTKTANEKCKELCDKVYNKCMDKCKDADCRNACFNDYVECLRDCDK